MKASHAFSPAAFEHLLCKLNPRVYDDLSRRFACLSRQNGESVEQMIAMAKAMAHTPNHVPLALPFDVRRLQLPEFDLCVEVIASSRRQIRSTLRLHTEQISHWTYGSPIDGFSCHLLLALQVAHQRDTYIVPLVYLMQALEKTVCRSGAYQLYQHSLIPERSELEGRPIHLRDYFKDAWTYIGITRRSWQKRFKEHDRAARNGSRLLFHRALRDPGLQHIEHIVVRAGLTAAQALQLEEAEVERVSLSPLRGGLNMIPGGAAGIRYLRKMGRLPPDHPVDPEYREEQLRKQIGNHHSDPRTLNDNQPLVDTIRFWREEVQPHLPAAEFGPSLIDYEYIQAARVLASSGWTVERILALLLRIDGFRLSHEALGQIVLRQQAADSR